MFEEDSLLDEQIKKKKRFVLLGLFTLLLIGTPVALSLITPTIPSSQLVAEAESKTPTPEQPASTPFNDAPSMPTPISTPNVTLETTPQPIRTVSVEAKTPGAIAEATSASAGTPVTSKESPTAVQGDEWQEPGTPASNSVDDTPLETATPPTATSAESKSESEETSSTPAGSEASETGIKTTTTPSEGTPLVVRITPTDNAGKPNQMTITVTIAPESSGDMPKGNSTATTDADEPNGSPITSTAASESNTAPQENKTPAFVSNEPLDINELPRVHESWGPTGEDEALSSVEAKATAPLTPTIGLTNTSAVSETELVIPNGLPITGISLRRGLNWAAVALVVLLLGAGITALRRPG